MSSDRAKRWLYRGDQDEVSQISVEPGDVLLLYTDGITEAFIDTTENQLGVEGLLSLLQKHGESSPDEISANIMDTLNNYEVLDDVSILVIKKTYNTKISN